jgi:hypothetical protein
MWPVGLAMPREPSGVGRHPHGAAPPGMTQEDRMRVLREWIQLRSLSSRRKQGTIWFQLTNVRVTTIFQFHSENCDFAMRR